MTDVFVYDAVRTPFGRYGGALAGTRPDDLAALVVGGAASSAPRTSTPRGSTRSCSATPTAPARTTATSPGWPVLLAGLPVVGAGDDGQPAVRLQPRRRDRRLAADRARRGRRRRGRRRRVDVAARRGCCRSRSGRSRPATPSWSRPRSAGGWSTPRCPARGRSRWARPPSSCASARASPARTRTSSRCARTRLAAAGVGQRLLRRPGGRRARRRPGPRRVDPRRHHRWRSSPASSRCSAPTAPSPPATPRRSTTARRRRCSAVGRGRACSAATRSPGSPAGARRPTSRSSSASRPSRRPTGRSKRAGIGWGDVGAVELNEAFAAQSLACVRRLGRSTRRSSTPTVARSRSATRSARPAPGSSARWPARLAASGERWGVAAICIGVGQGLAVVLENSRGQLR